MHREARGPRRRVLVVDGDPDVRRITAAFLREAGCEVAEAGDGPRALAALAADPAIGVLVTDLTVPGMGGAELVSRARELRPELPAIAVASTMNARASACLPADVPLLGKPFRQKDLLHALDLLRALTGLAEAMAAA